MREAPIIQSGVKTRYILLKFRLLFSKILGIQYVNGVFLPYLNEIHPNRDREASWCRCSNKTTLPYSKNLFEKKNS